MGQLFEYRGLILCQIWAAAAEAEADSGDLVLQSHRSWGPITDVTVSLLNPNKEVRLKTSLIIPESSG